MRTKLKILHPSPLAEVLKKIPLVYLATPYSRYLGGTELAFIDASKLAADLLSAGMNIFCPITHTHSVAKYGNIDPLDSKFWIKAHAPLMERSDALLIGKLHGWDLSQGVSEETRYFLTANRPIFFIDPYTMELHDQRARPL